MEQAAVVETQEQIQEQIQEQGALVEQTPLAEAQQQAPVALPQIEGLSPLAQVIATGNVSVEQVEKMMDLQERHEKREAEKAFNLALSEFRKVAPVLDQDRNVNFKSKKPGASGTNYNYTTLGHAMQVCNPLLGDLGLNLSWDIDELENGNIRVTAILAHEQGHSTRTSLSGPADNTGNKSFLQAKKSTISMLERITGFAVLGLASRQDDDDGQGAVQAPPRMITQQQESQLVDVLNQLEEAKPGSLKRWEEYAVQKWGGSPDNLIGVLLPASEFASQMAALQKRIPDAPGTVEGEVVQEGDGNAAA